MTSALTALGIACLILWGGLWLFLFSLQRRVDALEEAEREEEKHGPPVNASDTW